MSLLTICIPAYRSERFLAFTLAALQAQTFQDFRVRIALEPVEEGPTVDACRPFLEDPRFELVINSEQLGWDRNVRSLLREVRTSLFAIQPHDDIPQPGYLEALVGAVTARPDVSVAYSAIFLFGDQVGRRSMDLPDDSADVRELGFFLAGAEGHPFRGVTRREVLARDFPTNRFSGFAVETEWSRHLVQSGVALLVDRPLYLKRARTRDSDSVTSGWRFRMADEQLIAALEHNRARLLDGIGHDGMAAAMRERIELAAEASMLRRWQALSSGRLAFGPEQLQRAARVLDATAESEAAEGRRVAATVHVALSRHWQAVGDRAASERAARAAVHDAPDDPEPCLRLAQLLNTPSGVNEMVELLDRAARVAPLDVATLLVAGDAATTLSGRYGAVDA